MVNSGTKSVRAVAWDAGSLGKVSDAVQNGRGVSLCWLDRSQEIICRFVHPINFKTRLVIIQVRATF